MYLNNKISEGYSATFFRVEVSTVRLYRVNGQVVRKVTSEINVKGETRLKAVQDNRNCEEDSKRRNSASRTARGFR